MLDLSIHTGAESEALGVAFCALGIFPGCMYVSMRNLRLDQTYSYQIFLGYHISGHVHSSPRSSPKYVSPSPDSASASRRTSEKVYNIEGGTLTFWVLHNYVRRPSVLAPLLTCRLCLSWASAFLTLLIGKIPYRTKHMLPFPLSSIPIGRLTGPVLAG